MLSLRPLLGAFALADGLAHEARLLFFRAALIEVKVGSMGSAGRGPNSPSRVQPATHAPSISERLIGHDGWRLFEMTLSYSWRYLSGVIEARRGLSGGRNLFWRGTTVTTVYVVSSDRAVEAPELDSFSEFRFGDMSDTPELLAA